MVMLKADGNAQKIAIAHNTWNRTNKYKHNIKVLRYVNYTLAIILLISIPLLLYLFSKYYNTRR